MSDLGKPQTEWTRFLGKEVGGTFYALMRWLREGSDRLLKQRTQVAVLYDTSAHLGANGATLSGVSHDNIHIAGGGLLYVRITGGPTYTVSLYMATGGSSLVAQGTGTAGATVTLAAQNDSGMSGTWHLPGSVTLTTGDELRLYPVPDWHERLLTVWDGTEGKDDHTRNLFQDLIRSLGSTFSGAVSTVRGALETAMTSADGRGADFTGSSSNLLASDTAKPQTSGAVVRTRTGFIPNLRGSMLAETVGGEQSVLAAVFDTPVVAYSSQNDGQFSMSSITIEELAVPMVITAECIEGGDTNRGGQEKFRLRGRITGEDREVNIGTLQVGQPFTGRYGIGPLTLSNSYTKTGDGSNDNLAAASAATVNNARNRNTEGSLGTLYWRITEPSAGSFTIEFFKASSMNSTELVAISTGNASGASFNATEQNSSTLSVTWQLGSSITPGTTGTLVLNFAQVQNAAGIRDKFTITVTRASTGTFQRITAEEIAHGYLNSDPTTPTIPDGYVEAMTFTPYAVKDN